MSRLQELYKAAMSGNASEQELNELKQLLADPTHASYSTELIRNAIIEGYGKGELIADERLVLMQQAIMETVPIHDQAVRRVNFLASPKVKFWFRYAAAVIILFGAGIYFWNKQKSTPKPTQDIVAHDVPAPSSSRATITLADGQQIALDTSASGVIALQGDVRVEKLPNGQLAYSGTNNKIQYNTLSNPRGSGVVALTLADGTKVWLNAESSLKYPTAFIGTKREVSIEGEAFFEVAPNASMPFEVNKGTTKVQVLGTNFNINGYKNDEAVIVTLLQGSVNVQDKNAHQLLTPGQQAQVNNSGDIKLEKNADVENAVAWKNGLFNFDGMRLKDVMKHLERWYDIEVVYDKDVPNIQFYGKLNRGKTLSAILAAFRDSDVHFRLEGKTLTVFP